MKLNIDYSTTDVNSYHEVNATVMYTTTTIFYWRKLKYITKGEVKR